MKKLLQLLTFLLICMQYNQLQTQPYDQLSKLIKSSPDKLCIDQILKELNFKFNFGTFGQFAAASIFDQLCFLKPKLEENKPDGALISGITSYKNAQGKLKVTKISNNLNIAIGLQLPESEPFKLSQLSPAFAQLDNLIVLQNVALTISNYADNKGLISDEPIINGLNISAKIAAQGFMKEVLDNLGITDIKITVTAPQGFTNYKQIKLNFKPTISSQGICPAKALSSLITNLNLNFAKPLIERLEKNCFAVGSNLGVVFDDKNNPTFYLQGPISNGKQAMLKIKKDKDKTIYTIGFKPGSDFNFAQIDSSLSFVDEIIKFTDPTIIYTNGDKESIFDLNSETNTFDTAMPGAFSGFGQGITIASQIITQGSLKEVTDALGLSSMGTTVTIPKGTSKIQDIKIRFKPVIGDAGICPFQALLLIFKKANINLDLSKALIGFLNNTCVGTDVGVAFDEQYNSLFYIAGDSKNKQFPGKLMLKVKLPKKIKGEEKAKEKTLTIGFKPAFEFKFSKIDDALGFLDPLIGLSDPTISITTGNDDTIFDINTEEDEFEPKRPGAVAKLQKGITISATAQFKSFLEQALKTIAAQTSQIRVIIPASARKFSDIKIGITGTQEKEQKICLNSIMGKFLSGSFTSIANTCITGKHFELMPNIEKKSLTVEYDGLLTMFGKKDVNGKLFVDIKPEGEPSFTLFANIDGTIGLTSIANEFKPLELFILKNPKLVISNNDNDLNLLGLGKTKKGFTIVSDINWTNSALTKLMNQIGLSSGLTAQINVPLNPSDLSGFKFTIDKAVDKNLADVVIFKKLHLAFQGGIDPTIGLAIASSFKMPGTTKPIDLQLEGNANAKATFSLGVDVHQRENLPVINNPLGIPIKLTNPWVKVNFEAGEPTGLGAGGILDLGPENKKKHIDLTGDINLADPINSALTGTIENLSLTDLLFFYKNLVPQLGTLNIPDILLMKNLFVSFAAKEVTIKEKTIPKGIKLNGKVSLVEPVVNKDLATGTIDINIDPNLAHPSLSGNATLTPINFAAGLIKVNSATSGATGPSLGIAITPTEQKLWIDGAVNLAGIIQQTTKLIFDKAGFFMDAESLFAGVGARLHASFPFGKMEESQIQYIISDEKLIGFIKNDLQDSVKSVNNQATDVKNKINQEIKDLQGQCGNIIGIKDICSGSLEAVNQSVKLLDAVFENLTKTVGQTINALTSAATSVFAINNITATANLKALSQGGKLFTIQLDFELLGKHYTPSINMPIPKDAAEFAQKISGEIFTFIKPAFDQIFAQIKNLTDTIEKFIKGTIHLIGTLVDTAKAAGIVYYNLGKMVLTMSPESAKEFVNSIKDYGNQLIKLGSEIGGNIKAIAETIGNSIIGIANSLASNVEKAWHTILAGGGQNYAYSITNSFANSVDIVVLGYTGTEHSSLCNTFKNIQPNAKVEFRSEDCMPVGIYWNDNKGSSNKVYFSKNGMRANWNWAISADKKFITLNNWKPNCTDHNENVLKGKK